jgi:hypothetical protein
MEKKLQAKDRFYATVFKLKTGHTAWLERNDVSGDFAVSSVRSISTKGATG